MSRTTTHSVKGKQRGAALVVGLMLLLVITLLAISGMGSASLEFLMAGNEQYRKNAFQAAETGIEDAMESVDFDEVLDAGGASIPSDEVQVPNSATDAYSYASSADLNGAGIDISDSGSSGTKFTSYHFQVLATGLSARNARSVHVQGAALLAPKAGSDPGIGPDTLASGP